jgi:hypothetical protein
MGVVGVQSTAGGVSGGQRTVKGRGRMLRVATAERTVQRARKLDALPHRDMPTLHGEASNDEARWPPHARILFMIGAGVACWVVPVLLVYLLTF